MSEGMDAMHRRKPFGRERKTWREREPKEASMGSSHRGSGFEFLDAQSELRTGVFYSTEMPSVPLAPICFCAWFNRKYVPPKASSSS